ncbi:MAG: RsmE family RNA methyltransferase [Balneolaceae bacterium]
MNLFYSNSPLDGDRLILTGQEARHATRVMRYKTGDYIDVTDGNGIHYKAVITELNNQQVFARIEEETEIPLPYPILTLALGIIKKRDRLEFAVEKAAELGVNHIVLYRGVYSEKTGLRPDRLVQVAIRAMKQSLRCHLPSVSVKDSLKGVLEHSDNPEIIVADETAPVSHSDFNISGDHLLLITGPEGGFSENERKLISSYTHKKISFGGYRLRSETAAMIMVSKFRGLS